MVIEVDVTPLDAGFSHYIEFCFAASERFPSERTVYCSFLGGCAPPKWAVGFLPQLAHEAHAFFISFADMVGEFRELQKNLLRKHF